MPFPSDMKTLSQDAARTIVPVLDSTLEDKIPTHNYVSINGNLCCGPLRKFLGWLVVNRTTATRLWLENKGALWKLSEHLVGRTLAI